MNEESVVAVFDTVSEARSGLDALAQSGFPRKQVSLVARSLDDETEVHGYIMHGDRMEKDAAMGAGIGSLVGLLAGAAILWVPGFGPVVAAGPIGLALAGGIVGGILGAMTGWGVSEDWVAQYEDKVRAGKVLIVAHGDPRQVAEAHEVLEQLEPEELRMHAPTSADDVEDVPQER